MALSDKEKELALKWRKEGKTDKEILSNVSQRREGGFVQTTKDVGVGASMAPVKAIYGQTATKLSPFYWVNEHVVKPINRSDWMQSRDFVKNREHYDVGAENRRIGGMAQEQIDKRGVDAQIGDVAGQIAMSLAPGAAAQKAVSATGWLARQGPAVRRTASGLLNTAEMTAIDAPHDAVEYGEEDKGYTPSVFEGFVAFTLGALFGKNFGKAGEKMASDIAKRFGRGVTPEVVQKEARKAGVSQDQAKRMAEEFAAAIKQAEVKDPEAVVNKLMKDKRVADRVGETLRAEDITDADRVVNMLPKSTSEDILRGVYGRGTRERYKKMADPNSELAKDIRREYEIAGRESVPGTIRTHLFERGYTTLDKAGEYGKRMKKVFEDRAQSDMLLKQVFRNFAAEVMEEAGIKKFSKELPEVIRRGDPERIPDHLVEEFAAHKRITDFIHQVYEKATGETLLERSMYIHSRISPEFRDKIIKQKDDKELIADLMKARGIEAEEAKWALKDFKEGLASREVGNINVSPFERASKGGIPDKWLINDPNEIMDVYTGMAASRISDIKYFGAKGEMLHYGKGAIAYGEDHDVNLKLIDELFHQVFNRTPIDPLVRNLKAFNILKMGLSQIKNVCDAVPSAVQDGILRSMWSGIKVFTRPSVRKMADQSGSGLEDMAHAASGMTASHRFADTFLRASLFKTTQRFMDRIVAVNAIDKMKSLRKQLRKHPEDTSLLMKAEQLLGGSTRNVDLLIKSEDPKDLKFLQNVAGIQNIRNLRPVDVMDVPVWFNHTGAIPQLMLQFKRYAVNLGKVLNKEIVGNYKKGNVKDGSVALGRALTMLWLTGEIADWGQDRAKNMIEGVASVAAGNGWQTFEQEEEFDSMLARATEKMLSAGGVGLITDIFSSAKISAKYDIGPYAFMGPAMGDMTKTVIGGVKLYYELEDEEKMQELANNPEKAEKYRHQKVAAMLSPIPLLKRAYRSAYMGEKKTAEDSGIVAYAKAVQERRRPSVFDKIKEFFKGVFPHPGSRDAAMTKEVADQIKAQVAGINDAQTFQIMAGSDPSEVEVTGPGAETASEFLTRGLGKWLNVDRVVDGDTVYFTDGSRLRLIGVDTPETAKPWLDQPGEPGAEEAKLFTSEMLPEGEAAYVAHDEDSGGQDEYGRDLGYAFNKQGVDVNKQILEKGYGEGVYKFPFEREEEFKDADPRFRQPEKSSVDWMEDLVSITNNHEGSSESVGLDKDINGNTFNSYGSFQMNRGTAKGFAGAMNFENTDPESDKFKQEWVSRVNSDPDFREKEVKYMIKSHFLPMLKRLKKNGVKEEHLKDIRLGSLLFDVAINHGKNSTVPDDVFAKNPDISFEEAVRMITEERKRRVVGHEHERGLVARYDRVADQVLNLPDSSGRDADMRAMGAVGIGAGLGIKMKSKKADQVLRSKLKKENWLYGEGSWRGKITKDMISLKKKLSDSKGGGEVLDKYISKMKDFSAESVIKAIKAAALEIGPKLK